MDSETFADLSAAHGTPVLQEIENLLHLLEIIGNGGLMGDILFHYLTNESHKNPLLPYQSNMSESLYPSHFPKQTPLPTFQECFQSPFANAQRR